MELQCTVWIHQLEPTPNLCFSTVHYRLPTDTLQISVSGSNDQSKIYWQSWRNGYLFGFHFYKMLIAISWYYPNKKFLQKTSTQKISKHLANHVNAIILLGHVGNQLFLNLVRFRLSILSNQINNSTIYKAVPRLTWCWVYLS